MSSRFWESPKKSFNTGLFTDLKLFSEAMEIAKEQGYVTKKILIDELPQRVKGLLFVKNQSSRGIEDLIRELRMFNWLKSYYSHQTLYNYSKFNETAKFDLTNEGSKAYDLSKNDNKAFQRLLTIKMHDCYKIPGWFINRLWIINSEGQGEIVIPAPKKEWKPKSREWDNKTWTEELKEQAKQTFNAITKVSECIFPIDFYLWLDAVEKAWIRLSNAKQKKVAKQPRSNKNEKSKEKVKTFKPRRRLASAMQEATVKLLFSNIPPNSIKKDFSNNKEPISPRIYNAWCPRLEKLELLFYTDNHPLIPGRLIFPTSVFKKNALNDEFEVLDKIKNLKDEKLCLHKPKWINIRSKFLSILKQEHQRLYNRIGSLYVSLLDVRDEVCRQLRLSASNFDIFIKIAFVESLKQETNISMSIETDVREDQRGAHRLVRRPVYIDGIPHSLIAITETLELERFSK